MNTSTITESKWWLNLIGPDNTWVIEIFIVVLMTMIAALIARIVLSRLLDQAGKSKNVWDDTLIDASIKPLRWLIWLMGLTWAAGLAGAQSEFSFLDAAEPIRRVGGVILLSWFIVRFISRAELNVTDADLHQEPMDKTTVSAVGKLLRISVLITATLVVLQTMGVSVSGILAFGGVGGLAVGLAAKDLLANFFGGLMIYMDRPFKVGDWVRSPDRNIEGTVEDIGWRLTRIRTFSKRPLYVPNGVFTQIALENPSRMQNRRIYETIGLRYDDVAVVAPIVADVKAMLEQHKDLDHKQTLIVNFNAFAPSSLDFFVYTFTKTVNWVHFHEVKQDVMLQILGIISKHGAECAFPTSTLHVASAPTLMPGNLETAQYETD